MKIVRPPTKPSTTKFSNIPNGMLYDASDGLYRKLGREQAYHLGTLEVSTIGADYIIWNYIPYPNATLILEPDSEVKR